MGSLIDTCNSRLPGYWLPIVDNGVVPPDTDRLPHRVTKLALDLFARETGFSGPEIHDLFAEYTDVLGPYQGWGGGSMSSWQIFDAGLNSMALQQQRAFLLELCDYDGRTKYGMPADDQLEKLRSLLLADGSPGASAAGEGLAKLENWQAVTNSWTAALSKVATDPDGAITATRTTLESICKHICDERAVDYEDAWDLSKLYKATASRWRSRPTTTPNRSSSRSSVVPQPWLVGSRGCATRLATHMAEANARSDPRLAMRSWLSMRDLRSLASSSTPI